MRGCEHVRVCVCRGHLRRYSCSLYAHTAHPILQEWTNGRYAGKQQNVVETSLMDPHRGLCVSLVCMCVPQTALKTNEEV